MVVPATSRRHVMVGTKASPSHREKASHRVTPNVEISRELSTFFRKMRIWRELISWAIPSVTMLPEISTDSVIRDDLLSVELQMLLNQWHCPFGRRITNVIGAILQ